jgi:predicted RNase H-like HicB family nuclease
VLPLPRPRRPNLHAAVPRLQTSARECPCCGPETFPLQPRRSSSRSAVARKRSSGGRSRWYVAFVTFTIELERETDGRWLAEVPALSGVMCYGADRNEAVAKVHALALRVIAERLEHREAPGAASQRHVRSGVSS